MLNVTPELLIEKAKEHHITRWTCDRCSVCDYPMVYYFQSEKEIYFDPGCHCTNETHRERFQKATWKEIAIFINMQSNEERIKEIKEFWKL